MASSQKLFPSPPENGSFFVGGMDKITNWWRQWFLRVQKQRVLWLGDTTTGPFTDALPPANSENQGSEWVFKKISVDGNNWFITGAADGTQVISAHFAVKRFLSDGSNWWVV